MSRAVDFALTDEQQDFVAAIRDFCKREVGTSEQRERRAIVFSMLVSLFERAYLLLYEEGMSAKERRRWRSWEDYMREWCRRSDFRAALPPLMAGEDPEFVSYISALAQQEQE